ncbi:vtc domain-containing protein [Cystoisospora suis]|uniref:Vtc domain-containing protein n=1 Tax=Cystoisospora suis TaxID=483139 RepID=A0A2C6JHP6_9APIC|nr:vtc domain-containing protein [Cystoisospora suis]
MASTMSEAMREEEDDLLLSQDSEEDEERKFIIKEEEGEYNDEEESENEEEEEGEKEEDKVIDFSETPFLREKNRREGQGERDRMKRSSSAMIRKRWRKLACLKKVSSQSRNARKIDPKSFFANERTFLHYLQKSTYLGALAIALIQWSGGRWVAEVGGLLLALVVLLVLLLSFRIYEYRGDKLEKRIARGGGEEGRGGEKRESSERFDSRYGPLMISSTVTTVVVLVLLLGSTPHLQSNLKSP